MCHVAPPGTAVEIRRTPPHAVDPVIERGVIIHSAMTWLVAYFPGDPERPADPADPTAIRVLRTGDVVAYRYLPYCEPEWVVGTWDHLVKAGTGLLQAPQAVSVWKLAAELALQRLDAKAMSLITPERLEEWAGRPLTYSDLVRLDKAIPDSSVPEAIGMIVAGMDERDTEAIADLRGSMVIDYDAERVNQVLGRISAVSGLRIVCVWDYHDAFGFGGDSDFFVDVDGRFHYCAGDLCRWLNTPEYEPDAPDVPGAPSSWVGAPSEFHQGQFAYHDKGHNYALRDNLPDTV